jgi:DUF4097 and DUF4098 domain-containing protein YvlB
MRTAIVVGLLMLSLAATGLAHDGESSKFEKHLGADPNGVVEISNFSGTIQVSGWGKPEVEVEAEMGSGIDQISTESSRGRVSIKVIVTHHSGGTDLRVHIPRDSELIVSAVSADITVNDVRGVLQLGTISGVIHTDVFQKSAEIKTVSGDLVLRGRGRDAGADGIHASSISGTIRVDRAGGDLEAITVSGEMTLRLDHPAHDVRIRTTSGDVTFEGKLTKGGNLEAQSVSGDLEVRAAPDTGALDFEINTFSGDIKNCMGLEAERVSKHGPGRRLNGTHGTPGRDDARVRLKSMSGDVDLCDKA